MEKKTYSCRFNGSEIFLEVARDSERNLAYFKLYKIDQDFYDVSVFYRDFIFLREDDEVLEIINYCESTLKQKIYFKCQISQEGFEYLKSDK